MDTSELLKQVWWALLDWARVHRAPFSIGAAVVFGLVVYIVVPRLPGRPNASLTLPPLAPTTTINQTSGEDSSCSNMAATGNGSVTCSVNPEEKPSDKAH